MDTTATRVLVIDDEAGVRLVLRTSLRHAGFDVVAADSGQHGLELSRSWRPDVIVLDLMMPHLDGFAVLDRLARDGQASAPVIVLTAMSVADVKDRCLQAGASLVMTKPFDPDRLAAEIEALAHSRSPVGLPRAGTTL